MEGSKFWGRFKNQPNLRLGNSPTREGEKKGKIPGTGKNVYFLGNLGNLSGGPRKKAFKEVKFGAELGLGETRLWGNSFPQGRIERAFFRNGFGHGKRNLRGGLKKFGVLWYSSPFKAKGNLLLVWG